MERILIFVEGKIFDKCLLRFCCGLLFATPFETQTHRERERERDQMTEKERQKGVNTIVKLTDNTHIGTIKYSGILTLCWRHKQKLITEKER